MKVFTYSEARQNRSKILTLAQSEEIEIRRRDGAAFSLKSKSNKSTSPFDVPGIRTKTTTNDILDVIQDTRMG